MKYKLTKYLVIPAFVSLAYVVGFIILFTVVGFQIEIDTENMHWSIAWLGAAANWVLRVGFWIFMVLIFWWTYKFVIQTLLSPYLGALSENLERKMRGREPREIGWKEYMDDMIRAFRLSIRNLLYELLFTIVAGWIPLVGFIIVFAVSAYYTGFGYMDYTLERKRYTIRESVLFARKHSGLAVGIGTVANLALLIPIFGWLFMPTYATAAATLETMDELEELKPGSTGGGQQDPFARV